MPGTLLPGECELGLESWSPGCGIVSKHKGIGAFRMFIWIYVQNRKIKILVYVIDDVTMGILL